MTEIIKYENRKLVLPIGGEITEFKILDNHSSVEITYKVPITSLQKDLEDFFPIVQASDLTLKQGILAYTPKTEKQAIFKTRLEKVVKSGLSDFRAQSQYPIPLDGKLIYRQHLPFEPSISLIQWETRAKEVNPLKRSRLGYATQRIAFLGYIIKLLVEKHKYTLDEAWYAVCDDSGKIAYFANSNSKYLHSIGPFSDLGNGYSITINDLEESDCHFAFFGGHPLDDGKYRPLANIIFENFRGSGDYTEDSSCGWVVSDI